jgi:hypothetical protein
VHADELNKSIQAWIEQKPARGRAEFLPDRMGYRVILEEFTVQPERSRWGLLIGDCVHNLRSSLDNLCFALARLKQDPPARPHRLQFPVFTNAERFRQDRSVAETLEQLPVEVVEHIQLWQPFQRVDPSAIKADALSLLTYLSNQDKHRIPQVVLVSVNQGAHLAHLSFDSEEDAAAFIGGPPDIQIFGGIPMEPGSVLMQVMGNRRIASSGGEVTVEPVPAIQTLIALEGAMPVVAALSAHTAELLSYFQTRFFRSTGE